eukprot:33362-Rhodomonas_salina.1
MGLCLEDIPTTSAKPNGSRAYVSNHQRTGHVQNDVPDRMPMTTPSRSEVSVQTPSQPSSTEIVAPAVSKLMASEFTSCRKGQKISDLRCVSFPSQSIPFRRHLKPVCSRITVSAPGGTGLHAL